QAAGLDQPSPDQCGREASRRVRRQGQGFDVRNDEARLEPPEVNPARSRASATPGGYIRTGRFVLLLPVSPREAITARVLRASPSRQPLVACNALAAASRAPIVARPRARWGMSPARSM